MTSYVVVYDRARAKMLEQTEFADGGAAVSRRVEAEAEYAGNSNIEIVVLTAQDKEALHRSHRRYYENGSALVRAALDAARV